MGYFGCLHHLNFTPFLFLRIDWAEDRPTSLGNTVNNQLHRLRSVCILLWMLHLVFHCRQVIFFLLINVQLWKKIKDHSLCLKSDFVLLPLCSSVSKIKPQEGTKVWDFFLNILKYMWTIILCCMKKNMSLFALQYLRKTLSFNFFRALFTI